MTVHQRSVEVPASPEEVFRLLARPEWMPEYFPPVIAATKVGPELVRVTTGTADHRHDTTVRVEPDGANMRVTWNTLDTPHKGVVIIQEGPDFAGAEACIVTVIVDDGGARWGPPPGDLERTHDAGRFGGSHGREALPPLGGEGGVVTGEGGAEGRALGVGDVVERALGYFRDYLGRGGPRIGAGPRR